jgi:hypothetical protein
LQQKRQKNEQIKRMKQGSLDQVQRFRIEKQNRLKGEFLERTEQEKQRIYEFELEAQQLEQEEAQLIQQLYQAQQEEKEAYAELEQAMITASLSKKERLAMLGDF